MGITPTFEQLRDFSPQAAGNNMAALASNEYPGRLVGVGINDTGEQLHIVTATMGRSPSSQARTYELEGDSVLTRPLGKNPDPLTIYRTMTRIGDWHIATNGDQTDTVFDAIAADSASIHDEPVTAMGIARSALQTRNHEPDANHTPRISLIVGTGRSFRNLPVLFSIIRNAEHDPQNGSLSQYRFYQGRLARPLLNSLGYAITTYESNGDPLPPFQGGPRPISIGRDAEETATLMADVLDASGSFLVSAAAKAVDIRTGRVEAVTVINKYGPTPNYPAITKA